MNLAATAFKNKAFTHYVEVLIIILAVASYLPRFRLPIPEPAPQRSSWR
jgi:hypothetical protein